MARTLVSKPNTVPAGGSYPYGDVKDNSGANDGTNVNKNFVADWVQYFERIMALGGVVANGLPENSANGWQYVTALINIIVAQATTLVNSEASTRAAADTALTNNKVSKSGDTMSGNLALGGNKVTGSGTPTSGGDLTNKTYVDSEVSSEASTRSSADSSEASTRAAADTALGNSITSEASTRAAADTALGNNKADKAQGAWTAIPWINGWAGTGEYRTNQFGKTEFRGSANGIAASAVSMTNIGGIPNAGVSTSIRTDLNNVITASTSGALQGSAFGAGTGGDLSPLAYY